MDRLLKWCKNIKVSDPMDEGCRLGPVVSRGQVNEHVYDPNFFKVPHLVASTHFRIKL